MVANIFGGKSWYYPKDHLLRHTSRKHSLDINSLRRISHPCSTSSHIQIEKARNPKYRRKMPPYSQNDHYTAYRCLGLCRHHCNTTWTCTGCQFCTSGQLTNFTFYCFHKYISQFACRLRFMKCFCLNMI